MSLPWEGKWETVPLGSLAEFKNGVNYSKKNFGTGMKVINVKDFQDYTFAKLDDLEEINPKGIVREKDLLKEGDILFVRSNGNRDLIGRSVFVSGLREEISHSAFTIRGRLVSKKAYPRFYAYLFRAPFIRQTFSSYGGGTNISNLNQQILGALQVPLPPLETQRKIASILSAYDDLIENNTRRIKILEEMAQTIYREWFVNFRFPGHEKVRMVDSPLGRVPEGWEVGRLDDALVLQRGFDLPKKDRVEEGSVPVFAATGLNGHHSEAKVKAPCVITGRSGSLGTVIYVDEDFWPLNTTLWVKEFRRATPIFAYYLLSGLGLAQYNAGAAPTLNRNDIHGLSVVLPPRRLLEVFESHLTTIFRFKNVLQKKAENLRQTRDLLLPKLISGEVNVGPVI